MWEGRSKRSLKAWLGGRINFNVFMVSLRQTEEDKDDEGNSEEEDKVRQGSTQSDWGGLTPLHTIGTAIHLTELSVKLSASPLPFLPPKLSLHPTSTC